MHISAGCQAGSGPVYAVPVGVVLQDAAGLGVVRIIVLVIRQSGVPGRYLLHCLHANPQATDRFDGASASPDLDRHTQYRT